jgi:hypothetical protein
MGSCRFKLARLLCGAWHPCPLNPVVGIAGGGLKSFPTCIHDEIAVAAFLCDLDRVEGDCYVFFADS